MKRKKRSKKRVQKSGFIEQVRYAWGETWRDLLRYPLATLLTVIVIAISLSLPSIFYITWKNIHQAAMQWYPTPQLTVYLEKSLTEQNAEKLIQNLRTLPGIAKVNYISRDNALKEFREWSGFGQALDLLAENPLPAVAIITPTMGMTDTAALQQLSQKVQGMSGVDEVRQDESWFTRLSALSQFAGRIASVLALLMVIAVFLVIGNSVRSHIAGRRDSISVTTLLGATDGFVFRPFLYGGALLGFCGASLALLLSQGLVWKLDSAVMQLANIFGGRFYLQGFTLQESILLLLVSAMIGWLASWLSTKLHLHQFDAQ